MSFSPSTAYSRAKFAVSAELFWGRFDSHGKMSRASGAHANAEATKSGKRPAKMDARASIGTATNAGPRRRDSSGIIARVPVWKKLSAFNRKQRTCRRKNHLSRLSPLPSHFRPGNSHFPSTGACGLRRWRPLQSSHCNTWGGSVVCPARRLNHRAPKGVRWQGGGIRMVVFFCGARIRCG
jgi:hypothetical protein